MRKILIISLEERIIKQSISCAHAPWWSAIVKQRKLKKSRDNNKITLSKHFSSIIPSSNTQNIPLLSLSNGILFPFKVTKDNYIGVQLGKDGKYHMMPLNPILHNSQQHYKDEIQKDLLYKKKHLRYRLIG